MGRTREVARRAGVFVMTVTNLLNHPDVVADATRLRVLAAIEEPDEVGSVASLHNSRESVDREGRQLGHLLEQRVQGVLITPVDERVTDLAPFVARGIPVVLVDPSALPLRTEAT